MQTFNIEPTKTFVTSPTRGTRNAIVKKDVGATADYPEGLLLAVGSDGKLVPSDEQHIAVCALIAPIAKTSINASDVEASVVYLVGLGKPKMTESNPDLRITEAYIEKAQENGLDIKKNIPDTEVVPVRLIIGGSWTNTQYTERPVDPTGLTFKVEYADGGIETVTTTFTPSSWSETAGEQTATFSYSEAGVTVSAEKKATVVFDAPASLAVTGSWTNTQYTEQDVDSTGLTFKAIHLSGKETTVTSDVTVSPTAWGASAGEQTATFTYTEGGVSVTVTKDATVVLDVPSSLAISGTLTNEQKVSTAPDITGLTATATYLSGKTADVTASVTVTPATYGETAGTETLTLSYTESDTTVTASMEVTVTE